MATEAEGRGFEELLKELEAIVDRLESGTLSLENSLAAFEKGVGLVRELTAKLDDVERRVEVLTREDGESGLRVREIAEGEGS
jgi:exodeoxyribonuclease VII small subunit